MKKLLICCLSLLAMQPAFADRDGGRPGGPRPEGPAIGQPVGGDEERRRNEEEERRRQEMERQRQEAMRVEIREKVYAVGMDDRDCLAQADYRMNAKMREMVERCERDAKGFFRCNIDGKRVADYPTSIGTTWGSGGYDEKKTTEDTCRTVSAQRAESDAVSSCQAKYGVSCDVTARGNVTYHDIHHIRRYIIFGPREEYHKCKAQAGAAPASNFRVECSMEAVARPDLRGGHDHGFPGRR